MTKIMNFIETWHSYNALMFVGIILILSTMLIGLTIHIFIEYKKYKKMKELRNKIYELTKKLSKGIGEIIILQKRQLESMLNQEDIKNEIIEKNSKIEELLDIQENEQTKKEIRKINVKLEATGGRVKEVDESDIFYVEVDENRFLLKVKDEILNHKPDSAYDSILSHVYKIENIKTEGGLKNYRIIRPAEVKWDSDNGIGTIIKTGLINK